MDQIEYNGEIIQYQIIKSNIKNIYILVKEGKVIVKAPKRIKEKHIKEFVNKKSKWIYENIKKYKERPQEEIKEKDIQRLKIIINKNVKEYGDILQIMPNKVTIKDIKYAWGSCSSKKNITINLKLATKKEEIIKYVILHEMCHLKHMNHSKQFWNEVENIMPEYKLYRKQLKS